MAYRTTHDGPFVFQPEEIVDGGFLSPTALEAALAREKFCPDGLAVLAAYRTHLPEESRWAS